MQELAPIGLTQAQDITDLEEFPICQYTTLTRGEVISTLQAATFYMGGGQAWVTHNLVSIQVEVVKLWNDMWKANLLDDWIGNCKELGQHPLEALFFHRVLGTFYKDTWILKFSRVGFTRLRKYLVEASEELNAWLGMVHRQNRNFSWRSTAHRKHSVTTKLFLRGYGHYHRPLLDNTRSLIKRFEKVAKEVCEKSDSMLVSEFRVKAAIRFKLHSLSSSFEDVYGYGIEKSPELECDTKRNVENKALYHHKLMKAKYLLPIKITNAISEFIGDPDLIHHVTTSLKSFKYFGTDLRFIGE